MSKVPARSNGRHLNTITCSGCGENDQCLCLREWFLYQRSTRLVAALLDSGTDLVKRREARAGLREVLAHELQRTREYAALIRFRRAIHARRAVGFQRDPQICDDLLGDGLRRLTVAEAAARYRVSVEYVKALRDEMLRALECRPLAMPRRANARKAAA